MTGMLIDSGVENVRDLTELLPQAVRERLDGEALTEAPTAAALRVMATVRDEHWHDFVGRAWVDWDRMLSWSRENASASVRVRVELAASLAGRSGARASLLAGATALDEGNFAGLLDALRIAREGLAP